MFTYFELYIYIISRLEPVMTTCVIGPIT